MKKGKEKEEAGEVNNGINGINPTEGGIFGLMDFACVCVWMGFLAQR